MPDEFDPIKLTQSLYADLIARRRPIDRLAAYYDGDHPLAFTSEKFLEAFGGLFEAFADNWCQVVVGAPEERMQVQGFRAIGEHRDDDAVGPDVFKADDDASRIWERNDMDLQSHMAHTDALAFGAAVGVAWYDADSKAEITIESARNAIVRAHPKFRRRTAAGLRVWTDDDEFEHAELFTPDRVYLFRSRSKRVGSLSMPGRAQWVADDGAATAGLTLDASSSMENPLGRVPMVEFLNRPRLHISRRVGWFAHSELTPIIPLNDAINKMTADLLVASEFAAYPQRHVSKWQPDEDPDTHEVIPPSFKNGPGAVWWNEGDVEFGAFPAMDIKQYTTAIEMLVQHVASISATPPHYLNGSADRLSGESLKSAETGLVKKTRRKMQTFAPCWEELMRLAGEIEGLSQLAQAVRMETIWGDPETRSESEHIDAVVKKKALNVPDAQLQEEAGYGPDLIARFPAMRAADELDGLAAEAARNVDELASLGAG